MERLGHEDNLRWTVVTFTSNTTAQVERYDDFGVQFNASYTLTKQGEQPITPSPMVIETSKWERENGKLVVETTAGERYEFEALEGTDGYGFLINGELPNGLVINLPEMWGLDTDKSFAVTVAEKILPSYRSHHDRRMVDSA